MPEKNGLLFCELADLRSETFFAAPHLKVAPVHIVYVSNRPRTETLISRLGEGVVEKLRHSAWTPEKLEEMRTRSMIIDVGAKIQAVYMAAAAMDLSCVARTGFDAHHVERILRLQKGESVVAIQTLGYRPNSILDAHQVARRHSSDVSITPRSLASLLAASTTSPLTHCRKGSVWLQWCQTSLGSKGPDSSGIGRILN